MRAGAQKGYKKGKVPRRTAQLEILCEMYPEMLSLLSRTPVTRIIYE